MDGVFKDYVEQLPGKCNALLKMEPVTFGCLQRDMPAAGIYLFSEGPSHLYVGNSRRLKNRVKGHCSSSSKDSHANFAFKLACERTGNSKSSRKAFMADPKCRAAFDSQKKRISRVHVRFIGVSDPNMRALLEIYVTIALQVPYNDFDTH